MKSIAVYPGTFDPITYGHRDIIARAANLFDQVIVGVAVTERKQPLLQFEQRFKLVQDVVADLTNVEVRKLQGLTVNLVEEVGAKVIVRGLRGASDIDYELEMVAMNRAMAPQIETLFLAPAAQYARISSTIVREIAKVGGDVTPFVQANVVKALAKS